MTIGNGRIFTGFFYIPCGMILAKRRLSVAAAVVMGTVAFGIELFADNGLLTAFLTIIRSVSFFPIVEYISLRGSKQYLLLRKASKVLYFLHLYVWTFYYAVVYGEKTYGMDCFLVTTAICLTIFLIFEHKKIKIPAVDRKG